MADVTGRIGDNDVALDNAATESTLKDILMALKGQTSALKGLTTTATSAGVSPAAIAGANKGLQQLGTGAVASSTSSKLASAAMGGLSKGAMLLGGVLADMVSGAMQTGKNLTDLAGKMLDGKGSVSDVFGAFKDLPLGIGLVAGLFQKLMMMQEEELAAYREITKAGVNFGGELTDVRAKALELGTTLDGLGKFVSENSTLFAQLGGTADSGAKAFIGLSKDIRNSAVGKELMGLGYSIDDINKSTANYLKMTGGRTAEEMKNTKSLAASAAAYMTQLDGLAAITGKNVAEQEKALQEAAANAAWEAKLQSMSEEERKKANAALANAMAVGGKGAAQALQSKIMGIPPMTEAAQMFTAMSGNASKALNKQADAVTDSTKSLKDVEKGYGEMLAGSAQDAKNLGKEQVAAMSMTGGVHAEVALNAQKNANMMHSKNLKNADDVNKLQEEVAADQKKRGQSSAASAAEAEQAFKNLSSELMNALAPTLKELAPIVSGLAKEMIQFATKHMDDIKNGLKMVVDFVKNLFTPAGRDKIMNDISSFVGDLFTNLMVSILKTISGYNFVKGLFTSGERADKEQLQSAAGGAGVGGAEIAMADGGVAKGPMSGYDAKLHGTEAVVPLSGGREIPVNVSSSDMFGLGSFQSKMASMLEQSKADVNAIVSNNTPMIESKISEMSKLLPQGMQNMIAEVQKNPPKSANDALSQITAMAGNLFGNKEDQKKEQQVATLDGNSVLPKDLLTELQTLNKQTAQVLNYVKVSAELDRRNLDAIVGLNGNLLV
jgi:hypothetical protein